MSTGDVLRWAGPLTEQTCLTAAIID